MSAWDIGPFDNDDAMDFLGELAELDVAERPAYMQKVLNAVNAQEYLEFPEASAAVAAIAVIAANIDRLVCTTFEAKGVDIPKLSIDATLRSAAGNAIRRLEIAKDNEWYELWAEAGQAKEAVGGLKTLGRTVTKEKPQ
jgi:hypothetical protein